MPIKDIKCPECEGPMISRKSQYGTFWGCKNYPKCKGTRDSMGMSKIERELEREDNAQREENDPFNTARFRFRK